MQTSSVSLASNKQKTANICPKCSRVFDRKDNLQRHLRNKRDCSIKTTCITEHTSVQLLNTLLHVMRGPLKIDNILLQEDSTYEIRVICDVWKAIVIVSEMKKEKQESVFDILFHIFEYFNKQQLEILFGKIMKEIVPPNETLLHSLRAVYTHIYNLQKKGIPNLYDKDLPFLMKTMMLLPSLTDCT